MNLLFLDDERFPDEVFWIPAKQYTTCTAIQMVRTSLVFYKKLPERKWDVISFDNDIQEVIEGYDLLKFACGFWITKPELVPSKIILHTMNTIAKENMKTYLENFCSVFDHNIEIIV